MTLLCITSSIPGRTCVIRDHHLTTCADDTCKGCLPRPAETGHLCRGCWERFESALSVAVDLITHLRSVEKGPLSVVPTHSAPGSRVLLPGSWMEADNLWGQLVQTALAYSASKNLPDPVWVPMYDGFSVNDRIDDVAVKVRELVRFLSANPVDVVSRVDGAEAGVVFFRAVQRALAMFPLEDRARRVTEIRCRQCNQMTLLKKPPLEYLDDMVVECTTCGALYDPQFAEFDMLLLAEEVSLELSADLRSQVKRLLERPPAEVEALRGLSVACAIGEHGCEVVACRCSCHEGLPVAVGFGTETPMDPVRPRPSLPPSGATQFGVCPVCHLIHGEGVCDV